MPPCLHHRLERAANPAASDVDVQEFLLRVCQELSGIPLDPPGSAAELRTH